MLAGHHGIQSVVGSARRFSPHRFGQDDYPSRQYPDQLHLLEDRRPAAGSYNYPLSDDGQAWRYPSRKSSSGAGWRKCFCRCRPLRPPVAPWCGTDQNRWAYPHWIPLSEPTTGNERILLWACWNGPQPCAPLNSGLWWWWHKYEHWSWPQLKPKTFPIFLDLLSAAYYAPMWQFRFPATPDTPDPHRSSELGSPGEKVHSAHQDRCWNSLQGIDEQTSSILDRDTEEWPPDWPWSPLWWHSPGGTWSPHEDRAGRCRRSDAVHQLRVKKVRVINRECGKIS